PLDCRRGAGRTRSARDLLGRGSRQITRSEKKAQRKRRRDFHGAALLVDPANSRFEISVQFNGRLAKVPTPSSRSTESTRTTGASSESSIAATIVLSLTASRLRSNCSRD